MSEVAAPPAPPVDQNYVNHLRDLKPGGSDPLPQSAPAPILLHPQPFTPASATPPPAPEAPPATPTAPAPEAPAPPAAPEAPKGPKYASFVKAPEAPAPWTEEAKALFKSRGIEDPDAYFAEHQTTKEQLEQFRQKDVEASQVLGQINQLDPIHKEYLRKAANKEDALAWARSLPRIDLSKPAEHLDKLDLVEQYAPEAFTKEEREMLRNPKDHDKAEVEELQKRLDPWVKLAVPMHENARKSIVEAQSQQDIQRKAAIESINRGVAASVAHVRQAHPEFAPSITNELLSDYTSGKLFNNTFFETDGITPKPTALADLMTLMNLKEIMQDVREAALEEGRTEATIRAGTRNPTTAPGAGVMGGESLTPEQIRHQQHMQDLRG